MDREDLGFSMRVCIAYIGGLTPRKGGGVASVINNIVKYTSKKIEYSLLTIYEETELPEIQKIYPSTVKIEYIKPAGNVLASFLLYLVKEVDDFDILHFHDFPFGRDLPLALKTYLRGKNLVYSHHISLEQLIHNRLTLGYYYSVFKGFARIWRKVVANSKYIVDNDLSRFRSLQYKISVIRNGVDAELIRRVEPIDLDGEPSIVFVGHLAYRKGIDILLEAFNILLSRGIKANPKLHIVGSGILEKTCREYVARAHTSDKVCFWGSVPESLKFRIMKGSDIIVIPSRHENAPIILLEAMAAGKPVIASRVGGIQEVFQHGVNGILTDPSSDQIAIAIESLCKNERLVEEYERKNQEVARIFAWEKIAQSYATLYESIVSNDSDTLLL